MDGKIVASKASPIEGQTRDFFRNSHHLQTVPNGRLAICRENPRQPHRRIGPTYLLRGWQPLVLTPGKNVKRFPEEAQPFPGTKVSTIRAAA